MNDLALCIALLLCYAVILAFPEWPMITNTELLIDFTKLISTVPGEGLEQLARHLGRNLGLNAQWSGRGADGGRDLIFVESLAGCLSREQRRWLVSCKDKAKSKSTVQERDLPAITDKLKQHKAQGFIVVTTSTLSTGAKNLLDSLDRSNGGDIHTLVWDASELTNFLLQPQHEALLKQFLPESYQRIKQLKSLDDALTILQTHLPNRTYTQILDLVNAPTSRIDGSVIWPYDRQTATSIEYIAKLILQDLDWVTALEVTEQIDFDAFVAFASRLYEVDHATHYQFLCALVERTDNHKLQYNVLQLLLDVHEIPPIDWIRLASGLDDNSLRTLFGEQIVRFVKENLYRDSPHLEFTKQLAELCDAFDVNSIIVETLKVEPQNHQFIKFSGDVVISITLWDEIGRVFDTNFKGVFSGLFDQHGMYLDLAKIDTDNYETMPLNR